MRGPSHPMKALETRKRLLLAESDLLRVQLSEDFGLLRAAWARSGIRGRPMEGVSSGVALLMACLGAFGRVRGPGPLGGGRRSWIERLFRGVGVLSTLWLGWRRARGARP